MTLQKRLADCANRLRGQQYANEQSISLGVVLPVLGELDWDVFDTEVVCPEFSTGEGRVDFALCDPPLKPKCFVEVKQPGKAEGGVRQALQYAFHSGVPFVVLTDGETWSFYLPAEPGTYEDRRVFKLDLLERDSDEAAKILTRYLLHQRVVSGASLETARAEYRSKSRREEAKRAIPDVWADLIAKGDELLVDLIAEAVESKSGVKPERGDVSEFLGALAPSHVPSDATTHSMPANPPKATERASPAQSTKRPRGELEIRSQTVPFSSATDALVKILVGLARDDETFFERCSLHSAFAGRKRRFIGRRPEELYPGRPDLHRFSRKLTRGWMVDTNNNTASKLALIKAAAEVAGLEFGKEVRLDL